MCLFVYLGVDRPLLKFSDPPVGEVGLNPDPYHRPKVLADKRLVYRVADRLETGWNCSCIFLDDADPSEYEDIASREKAYESLARIARAALNADAEPLIFSYWAGGEIAQSEITRSLTLEEIRFGRCIFDDQLDDGTGANPPVLIQLKELSAEDTE
jgi:hypothetical protein